MPPKIRIHGHLRPINKEPLTNQQVEELLLPSLDEKRSAIFAEKNDLDWAYAIPGVARFRCSFFRQQHGMSGVFRIIPEEIKTVPGTGSALSHRRFL